VAGNRQIRLLVLVGVVAVVLAIAWAISLKSILVLLLGTGLVLALNTRHSPLKLFTWMLLLLGLAIALGTELIYIRDFLDNSPWERMNTVFKFYYQVWTLFALGGALAFAQLVERVYAHRPTDRIDEQLADDSTRQGAASHAFIFRCQVLMRCGYSGW